MAAGTNSIVLLADDKNPSQRARTALAAAQVEFTEISPPADREPPCLITPTGMYCSEKEIVIYARYLSGAPRAREA